MHLLVLKRHLKNYNNQIFKVPKEDDHVDEEVLVKLLSLAEISLTSTVTQLNRATDKAIVGIGIFITLVGLILRNYKSMLAVSENSDNIFMPAAVLATLAVFVWNIFTLSRVISPQNRYGSGVEPYVYSLKNRSKIIDHLYIPLMNHYQKAITHNKKIADKAYLHIEVTISRAILCLGTLVLLYLIDFISQ